MKKLNSKYLFLLTIVIYCLLINKEIYCQFGQPLPLTEVQKYKDELKDESLNNLVFRFNSEISSYYKEMILDELAQRKGNSIERIYSNIIDSLSQKIKKSNMVELDAEMLRAKAFICKIKIQSNSNKSDYVNELNKQLLNDNPFIVDACAVELGQIATPLARAALKKCEINGRPQIKINRLRIDTKNMSPKEFSKYIFKSAQESIDNSDTSKTSALVAEKSLLVEHENKDDLTPFIKNELEQSKTSTSKIHLRKKYMKFLQDVQKNIEFNKVQREQNSPANSKSKILVNSKYQSDSSSKEKFLIETDSLKSNHKKVHKENFNKNNDEKIFKKKTVDELLELLSSSSNIEDKKICAKILGDLYISDSLKLINNQDLIMQKCIEDYFVQIKSENVSNREESRNQIYRLWHLAVPTLLKNLDNDDPKRFELAAKSLIVMRNETIIKAIIKLALNTKDHKKRKRFISLLSGMQGQQKTYIDGRDCINDSESKDLYNRFIVPALEELKKNK
jgi:hypothetical protein